MTAAERRHERVEKWTKNVNLFEKDFLIVPINKNAHWFLAIICYPYLSKAEFVKNEKKTSDIEDPFSSSESNKNTEKSNKPSEKVDPCDLFEADEAESGESNHSFTDSHNETGQCLKRPIILIFDSLPSSSKKRLIATLKE